MSCENKLGKASASQVGFAGFFCLFGLVCFCTCFMLFGAQRDNQGRGFTEVQEELSTISWEALVN